MKELISIDLGRDKSKENPYISETLFTEVSSSLEKGEKVLLYINKRGSFSSYICGDCSYIFSCKNCDLSLKVHNNPDRLICHHCLYEQAIEHKCTQCHSSNLHKVGVGTMQIEETMKQHYSDANLYRFDTDQLSTVKAKKEALSKLAETDIIIGTKMISTGFNIPKLSLICVILLEQELGIPSYKNDEQVYSNLRQLIGRGGRKGQSTKIILQSYVGKNKLLQNIHSSNYKDFFLSELEERKSFSYPPFVELAYLYYKHTDQQKSLQFMTHMYEKLSQSTNGTIECMLAPKTIKRNNQYFSKIILKGKELRKFLAPFRSEILKNKDLSLSFEY